MNYTIEQLKLMVAARDEIIANQLAQIDALIAELKELNRMMEY